MKNLAVSHIKTYCVHFLPSELSFAGTNWTADFPGCRGQHQSPINIDSDNVTLADFRELHQNEDMTWNIAWEVTFISIVLSKT